MQTHERNEGERERKRKAVSRDKRRALAPTRTETLCNKRFRSHSKREWVYGRHYIRKFLSVTVAGGGTGKTALTMAEAVAMATGRNLLGVETEKRRVWVGIWKTRSRNCTADLQPSCCITALTRRNTRSLYSLTVAAMID